MVLAAGGFQLSRWKHKASVGSAQKWLFRTRASVAESLCFQRFRPVAAGILLKLKEFSSRVANKGLRQAALIAKDLRAALITKDLAEVVENKGRVENKGLIGTAIAVTSREGRFSRKK